MNDLGSLATKIVNYEFSEDRQRFPVSYVSGWLETNIGELNGLTNEEFYVNGEIKNCSSFYKGYKIGKSYEFFESGGVAIYSF